MMKRIWELVKKVPIIGWLLAFVGLVLGGLFGRGWGRPTSATPAPAPGLTPAEVEEAKEEIREDLEEELTDIDNEWDDLEDAWNDKFK